MAQKLLVSLNPDYGFQNFHFLVQMAFKNVGLLLSLYMKYIVQKQILLKIIRGPNGP